MAATRILLVCHASTEATRRAAFARDEPLDSAGSSAAAAAERIGRHSVAVRGPTLRCEQTTQLLGIDASVDPALDEWNMGVWAGRTIGDLLDADKDLVERWRHDEDFCASGGESLTQLLDRAHEWLTAFTGTGLRVVAVTHAAVIRAAIVGSIGASPEAFWLLDVPPLARVSLSEMGGRWTLQVGAASGQDPS